MVGIIITTPEGQVLTLEEAGPGHTTRGPRPSVQQYDKDGLWPYDTMQLARIYLRNQKKKLLERIQRRRQMGLKPPKKPPFETVEEVAKRISEPWKR
jgi:hypothetical protein